MAPLFNYKPEQMAKALEDVRSGLLSLSAASKKYEVPRSTLEDKFHGRTPENRRMGPDTTLTKEEESGLVEWMFRIAKAGFFVTKEQILDSVQLLLESSERQHNFKNGRPGRHWYEGFQRRHPEISARMSQNHTTKSRDSVTEASIRRRFNDIRSYLAERNFLHILGDSTRVFNCEEVALFLQPKGDQVLVKKGQKNLNNLADSDEKECLTTLFTGNASGVLAPPMVVFQQERLPKNMKKSVPDDWAVGKSETGWMTGMNFHEYLVDTFHPWLLKEGVQLPVILFLDAHSSYLTKQLSDHCTVNGIIPIALYLNSTHTLRPMNIALFQQLKHEWKSFVREWRITSKIRKEQKITKEIFAQSLQPILANLDSKRILADGFSACGLCPFNPDVINYSKLLSKNPAPCEVSGSVEVSQNLLRQVEYEIGDQKLCLFERAGEIWTGDIQDTSLFHLWLSLKRKAGEEIIENDVVKVEILSDVHLPDYSTF